MTSFDALLAELLKQHKKEIGKAVNTLREENQRLKEELLELRGQISQSDGRAKLQHLPNGKSRPKGSNAGSEPIFPPPLPALPHHLGHRDSRERSMHIDAWAPPLLDSPEPPILQGDAGRQVHEDEEEGTPVVMLLSEPTVELKGIRAEHQHKNQEGNPVATSPDFDMHNIVKTVGWDDTETETMRTSEVSEVFTSARVQKNKALFSLNIFVGVVIAISFLTMGLSMDIAPEWPGWVVVEFIYGAIFLFEIVVKIRHYGCLVYICGPQRYLNWLDCVITFITLLDATMTSLLTDDSLALAKNMVVPLRAARILRIVPLIKLLDIPILARLASMFTGLSIGMPWLIWVSTVLVLFVYLFGIMFRQLLGPDENQDLRALCGDGDLAYGTIVGDGNDPYSGECKIHYLYGEEYFGTVPDSMFTIFRCMIGDCSTKGGQALAPHLGFGYGLPFYIVYAAGMVVIIFGLFNVITAIFVESTMEGLKYSDAQKIYARKYKFNYVKRKLEELLQRIQTINFEPKSGQHGNLKEIERQDFAAILRDDVVIALLEDLDVSMDTRQESLLFDVFDVDHNGSVSVSEFLDTLMRMRGEPTKCDMVASWVSLRKLSNKVRDIQDVMRQSHADLTKAVQFLSRIETQT
mmetsp:Transcript_108764/g.232422  ORF Transcript_108764/g.232422 Transcript_108764/m.232422 type:complete len:635 (+) Transcript_108764:63-1967(+)|eukprot:CAMPEP_0180580106 /NCGR_PEP_ID=MMETSP1037_2-20121125/13348_1 /TAXON_ID=632150 /ORGANISM="Azadinium spinosum, Strain 3D9" /LENGTH=634 /DNA_ID=CAMNT_0022598013 /DNA_START=57 /DNA_END=1961 /DNA_ORIENTATION=-